VLCELVLDELIYEVLKLPVQLPRLPATTVASHWKKNRDTRGKLRPQFYCSDIQNTVYAAAGRRVLGLSAASRLGMPVGWYLYI